MQDEGAIPDKPRQAGTESVYNDTNRKHYTINRVNRSSQRTMHKELNVVAPINPNIPNHSYNNIACLSQHKQNKALITV